MVGFSGSDKGVMSCLSNRISNYTLYWLKMNNVGSFVEDLVKQQGKFIKRKSSDEFFIELLNKISYYSSYERGETPEFIIHMVKKFIKEDDYIDFKETLKKQMKIIEEKWFEIYASVDKQIDDKNQDALKNGFKEFEKNLDLITAIGLTLIEYPHDFINVFFNQLQMIYDFSDFLFDDQKEYLSKPAVRNIPRAAIFDLYHVLGAYCLKEENLATLKTLFKKEISVNIGFLVDQAPIWSVPEIFAPITFQRSQSEIFDFLIQSFEYKIYLKEFFRSKHEFKTYICQFNFLLYLYISSIIIKTENIGEYDFYPNFARYSTLKNKITIPLMKYRSNGMFRKEMANAFDENPREFLDEYENRCGLINEVIEQNLDFRAFKVPCWLFEDIIHPNNQQF